MPSATHTFSLQPFSQTALTTGVTITGTVVRDDATLSIEYLVAGDWETVITGNLARSSQENPPTERRDRLWEHTCFECFIAPVIASETQHTREQPYWEVNLSPQGHWNVFSLTGYRQDLREEQAIASIPFTVNTSPAGLHLTMHLDINQLIPPKQPIRLGISMIVLIKGESEAAKETFWAIAHPGPEADFHHPASFVIPL